MYGLDEDLTKRADFTKVNIILFYIIRSIIILNKVHNWGIVKHIRYWEC